MLLMASMAATLLLTLPGAAFAAPTAGSIIAAQAYATYVPASGFAASEVAASNMLNVLVDTVEALSLSQDQAVNAVPGGVVSLPHVLTNTGNADASYTVTLANPPGNSFDLSSLRVVLDTNGNGVAEVGEASIALGVAGALQLPMGKSANLLVTGVVPAGVSSGATRVRLSVVSGSSSPASASNLDTVTVANLAVVQLTQSASEVGTVVPGTVVRYALSMTNSGASDATGLSMPPLSTTSIRIDGAPASVLLIRDPIPSGTSYVAGSLATGHTGAIKLFRLPGDPPLSYRTGADDMAAVEVAIALPDGLQRNASMAMTFSAKVAAVLVGTVRNVASVYFNDGAAANAVDSNAVLLTAQDARIGIAKAAGALLPNRDASGAADGTVTVPLSFVLRNYGAQPLFNVQASDVLAGSARFGTYTSAAVPASGQYTVVAGSLVVSQLAPGASAAANSGYTGSAGADGLLAAGATLPAGGSATVSVQVRFYSQDRVGAILNTATATASQAASGLGIVSDDSVDGSDPDPDGDGDPRNNASPTVIRTGLALLQLTKTSTVPVRVSGTSDTFTFEYHFVVRNAGSAPLNFLRVTDNLNCAFLMDQANGPVASWQLTGVPTMRNGLLVSAGAGFTGQLPCDRARWNNGSAAGSLDPELVLNLTDGTRGLQPGESEEIVVPVKLVRSPTAGVSTTVLNKAVAAALDANSVAGATVVAASASTTSTVLADPSGVVYRSGDRTPISGAVVTLRRTACTAATAGPITADQLEFSDIAGRFVFNADGSVSTTTAADGVYQFLFRTPPVNDVCDYTLAVTAPDGLVSPSTVIAPSTAVAPGGAVQPQDTAPAVGQSTTYYLKLHLGPGLPGVWNNHIPLDAVTSSALQLKKEGSKTTVEIADFITYVLSVANRSAASLHGLSFVDNLPAGFAYVPGSARLVDAAGANSVLADPAGGTGPRLSFDLPNVVLAGNATVALRYRVRVGVGATQGDGINRALVKSGSLVSTEAAFRTTVTGGVFADEAILFGKVYLDCNRNGVQDAGELGVPNVRLLLQNGTSVVTDVEGKWSIYGLKPVTHVVKVDTATLPEGAVLGVLSNRNAGAADSRFADLKKGELHRADFAIVNCGPGEGSAVLDAAKARRQALQAKPGAEGEAVLKRTLDPQAKPYMPNDVRALPAAGNVGTAPVQPVAPGSANPLVNPAAAMSSTSAAPVGSAAASAPAPTRTFGTEMNTAPTGRGEPLQPLEELVPSLDNAAGFIGLDDLQVLPTATPTIRVKGRAGRLLRLSVNGEVVPERRVGKKSELASKGVVAWEYIGVELRPGRNRLLLEEVDSASLVARSVTEITVVAPGKAHRVLMEVPASATADARTPVRVKVSIVDDHGVPVTSRTQVTLETSLGRWDEEDMNPLEPGTQRVVEGGSAEFTLVPPTAPGTAIVRASAGVLTAQKNLDFLPEMRPLVGAGLIEGVIDLRSLGRTSLQPARAKDSFDAELTALSASSSDGRRSAAARAAFYFKGTIKGEYLLTTAYDSDKTTRDRLFRDIQPDEFYPVYGDSAVKSFDAQSTGHFYVRIDKAKSYLLYGDFNTASSPEVRQLTQFNHSVTGVQLHHETQSLSATAFASRDTLRQLVVEYPANGTSGPFMVGNGNGYYENSERVELVVRDRRQSSNIISVTSVARFADYQIDATTGRLLFNSPVAGFDADMNPRTIRITYEVDSGGPAFWVAGGEVQYKVTDDVQVGVVYGRNGDPTAASTLAGVTGVAKLGEKTVATAELARTDTMASGTGQGGRVEIKREEGDLRVRGQVTATSANFDNPGAYAQKGRADATLTAAYKIGETTSLTAEAVASRDRITGDRTAGVLAGVTTVVAEGVQLELGGRIAQQQSAASSTAGTEAATTDLHTVRAKLSVQPKALPQAKGYIEAEQDVGDSEKRLLAVGGTYQVGDKSKVYGRYEVISSLGNPFQLGTTEQNNTAALGVETEYLSGHSAFGEYRVRDTLAGREDQLATGLRSNWKLTDRLRLGGSIENTAALGGVVGERSTAIASQLEYAYNGLRAEGRLELRQSSSANSVLNTLGLAYKLDDSWSLLARSVVDDNRARTEAGTDTLRLRQQIGLAYRPVDSNDWNALLRYEHRYERADGQLVATTDTNPGLTRSHILSSHLNYQARKDLTLSARYALKYSTLDADGLRSSTWAQLFFGRAIWDITPKWDAGVQVMALLGQGGVRQPGFGVEGGYLIADNTWLSVGFNVFNLRDPALAGNDYLDRGLYVRLRFKFDEGLFK